jgi:hypothetical protein
MNAVSIPMEWGPINWRAVYPPALVAEVDALVGSGRLDEAAERLYDASGSRASSPPWAQLGDVTRSVWRERAEAVTTPRE